MEVKQKVKISLNKWKTFINVFVFFELLKITNFIFWSAVMTEIDPRDSIVGLP